MEMECQEMQAMEIRQQEILFWEVPGREIWLRQEVRLQGQGNGSADAGQRITESSAASAEVQDRLPARGRAAAGMSTRGSSAVNAESQGPERVNGKVKFCK